MTVFAHPADAGTHLTPETWARANRHLVRKAIAEFAHEQLLVPERIGPAERAGFERYRLAVADTEYLFVAQAMALRHWRIDAASIRRNHAGTERALDAVEFIIEFAARLGLDPAILPAYLEEIGSTLFGAAYKLSKANPTSAQLVEADYQTVEASMTEGHPGFVANNGRLGFDASDHVRYAPETASGFALIWLAVHRSRAHFASVSDLSLEQLLAEELGVRSVERFEQKLRQSGLEPSEYLLMPAHPWQWFKRLAIGFAGEIAQRRIVCLGESDDRYAAQQSIRTCFNLDRPSRRYVKTSLSIVNMGFVRGLSPAYMAGTPAINECLSERLSGDRWLAENGFSLLREVASIGYRHPHYEAATPTSSPYRKMLAALWRESPIPRLRGTERLMSMTALLHVDAEGTALAPLLIARSGLGAQAWLARYLDAYLAPLLHCFYVHDLSFMPHGENVILVIDRHVPVRIILKDIAEETALMDKGAQVPPLARRLLADVPDQLKLLCIFIDVFDGFFRHLAHLLVEADVCAEACFWHQVAKCIRRYQAGRPELAEKFARYDLFAPKFAHSCLNRLQLANNQQMVNLNDVASSLKMAEPLDNPLAPYRTLSYPGEGPRPIGEASASA